MTCCVHKETVGDGEAWTSLNCTEARSFRKLRLNFQLSDDSALLRESSRGSQEERIDLEVLGWGHHRPRSRRILALADLVAHLKPLKATISTCGRRALKFRKHQKQPRLSLRQSASVRRRNQGEPLARYVCRILGGNERTVGGIKRPLFASIGRGRRPFCPG